MNFLAQLAAKLIEMLTVWLAKSGAKLWRRKQREDVVDEKTQKVEKLREKIKQYYREGKPVPADLQKQFDEALSATHNDIGAV